MRNDTGDLMQGLDLAVVIPAYNVRRSIRQALRSVQDQDPRPEKVIVVDDGSTDGTADEVVESEEVVLVHQENRGPGAARNTGVRSCTNRWILFLDADDELLPGSVRTLERALANFPDSGAAVGNRLLKDASTGTEDVLWGDLQVVKVLRRKDVARLIRLNDLGANAVVRRDVWQRSPFREDLRASEDQAFWIDLLLAGVPVLKLPEVLVRYAVRRPDAASTATKFMREQRAQLFRELSRRPELSRRERVLAGWMGLRAGAGAVLAR